MPVDRRSSEQRRPGRWWRAARAVFRKEMLETLRDRRTLIAAVLLPALTMPLVVLVMPALVQRQAAMLRERPARIAIQGGDTGGLAALGFDEGTFSLVSVSDPREALLRGEIDAVLVDEGPASERPRVVAVLYDETRPGSAAAVQKVMQVAAKLALRELQQEARSRGADPSQIVSVVADPRNVAPRERQGGALLATALPFFLAVWVLLGGQYAALDVGVGERERGSLEGLLATPPARTALVVGKFLAVLGPALLAVGVMIASAVLTVVIGRQWMAGEPAQVALPLEAALPLLLVGAALASLLSAAQLLVSLAARTLREAQQAFTGLYLVVAMPVMLVPLLSDWRPPAWAVAVPVLNAVVAFRSILTGIVLPGPLAGTMASSLVLTVPLLLWGVRLLEGQARAIR